MLDSNERMVITVDIDKNRIALDTNAIIFLNTRIANYKLKLAPKLKPKEKGSSFPVIRLENFQAP